MQVIREICDQVVVIDKGEIVESGQVWSVFSNPQQSITQELLNLEQLDLPFKVYDGLNELVTHSVIKLKYATETKYSPDLADVLSQFEQSVYLYQSHVDTIQNHLVGTLIVTVPDLNIDIEKLKNKFRHQIAQVEVLGYARPTY